jgi:anti-sigma regulatory factor (Ser/Thr protein kinase)
MRSMIENPVAMVCLAGEDGFEVLRRSRPSHGGGEMRANHRVRAGSRPAADAPSAVRPAEGDADDRGTLDWRISVPGVPAIVAIARRLVRAALWDSRRLDDIELVASELVTNAIRHTPSGRTGSLLTLRIRGTAGWARIEVNDLGSGSWAEPSSVGEDGECGRGLVIVNALADLAGHEPAADGQVSWAEIHWDVSPDAARTRAGAIRHT